MIRNYFKIAWRYLLKNKLYTSLNILGLALGIAAFLLIISYVDYERSYDQFDGSENIYRVYMDYAEGNTFTAGDAQTYNLSGPTLKKEFPEIIEQTRIYRLEKCTFLYGDKTIEQPSGSLADGSYFEIFNKPLVSGSLADFDRPNSIVLTATLASKIFGGEDPIGKSISIYMDSNEALLEVVGLIEDIPDNTHMKTNYLISYNTINTWEAMSGQSDPNWSMNNFFTYIKIEPNTNVPQLREKIKASNFEEDPNERHNIEPLEDIHLYSNKPYEAEANGSVSRVRFLSAIAIIILILSWLNYVNLSTAKSLERAKEVGIRKVAGAQRPQLVLQSLSESLLLNLFAIVLAIGLVLLLLPVFNSFLGKSLSFTIEKIVSLLPYLSIILLGTLLSGLYPALVISKFSPLRALKGKLQTTTKGFDVRKVLITLQFFATVVLIIGTLVVAKQINFLRNQPIGVNLTQVVSLKGEVLEEQADSLLNHKVAVLRNQLLQLPFVEKVANSQTFPGDGYDNLSSTVGITYPNGVHQDRKLAYFYGAQPDYFKVINLEFLAGKPFPEAINGVENRNIVINETFAKDMGMPTAELINKTLQFWGITWTITGVVEDYHHFGLKYRIEPLMVLPYNGLNNVLVKMDSQSASLAGMSKNLKELTNKWEEVFPQSTLDYSFLDSGFEAQYEEDQKFGRAFQVFTVFAIIIAALGLFGLTSYTCLQRRKEIGIRKVSGASVLQILTLLNKDFLKLVGISFILAVPIAWYVMEKWLQEFAYQTKLSWWIFVLAGTAAFTVALISVSFQAIKAAIANPIKSLRTE